ncbi:MAG: cytochrome-c oxidase, cbb3-type subunit II [Gemmatimonadota bacterium]|nr:MAG: cytochrome-c oxidase, cbb3-type subunit II [Gemmatimonadota bacterium]
MAQTQRSNDQRFHRRALESKAGLFTIVTTLAISVGGIVEIVPMFTATAGPERPDWVSPYTPLEVAGRDIYVREGCYVCHSQWVRPMRAELLRYGEWSRAGEYRYDRPFLLGSRRIGPDIHRVGRKYPDAWHYEHMRDPRTTTPGSVMPPYPWLLERTIDAEDVAASVRALRRAGTPYSDQDVANVHALIGTQADGIVQRLAEAGIQTEADREIVALIAFLQRLGRDGRRAIEQGLTSPTEPAR